MSQQRDVLEVYKKQIFVDFLATAVITGDPHHITVPVHFKVI